jgi:hypothetical protein
VIDLRQVLPPHASDFEALDYAREHGLLLITCNRDDFLALVADKQVCSMNAMISAAVTRSETTGLRARLDTSAAVWTFWRRSRRRIFTSSVIWTIGQSTIRGPKWPKERSPGFTHGFTLGSSPHPN